MSKRDHAVLIPTRSRPGSLAKLFRACPSLNGPCTYIGVEPEEEDLYIKGPFGHLWNDCTFVQTPNPGHYPSNAREILRQVAISEGPYRRYVLSDDNCRFSERSLKLLLAAQKETGGVVAGAHGTFRFFHKHQIDTTKHEYDMPDGSGAYTVYNKVQMIFWVIPHSLYECFEYPPNVYYDDVYFIFWAMNEGFDTFRVCLEATFDKRRHEAGGTGNNPERVRKACEAIIKIAEDFPQWAVPYLVKIRPPYQYILRGMKYGKNSST